MTRIPTAYSWLETMGALPAMVRIALAQYGVQERIGAADNEHILEWAKELGGEIQRDYHADAVPWCGLFLAIVARRAGKPLPAKPLWALSWAGFGVESERPSLGDVLVFKRDGGGHVGLYIGEDDGAFHVLGGNQGDRVCFTRIAKARLYRARRPEYRNRPASAVPFRLAAAGRLSVNEA